MFGADRGDDRQELIDGEGEVVEASDDGCERDPIVQPPRDHVILVEAADF